MERKYLTHVDDKELGLSRHPRCYTFPILIELSPNNNLKDVQATNNIYFVYLRFFH